jgi:hypothetical protein
MRTSAVLLVRMWRRAVTAWAIWLCGIAPLQFRPLQAETLPQSGIIQPAQAYRRIFVPGENVDAWPRDGEKYLPIETREFEALVASANRRAKSGSVEATIIEARYSARLEGNRLVAGRGEWTIEMHGEEPEFLHLGDMSLVVSKPRWQEVHRPADDAKSAEPALLGAWGSSGGLANQRGLEVARSGVLQFDWHSRSPTAQERVAIEWRMPTTNSTRLVLDLPEGKVPLIDGGIVVQSRQLPATGDTNGELRWQWELALAALSSATLRIMDADGALTDESPELAMREKLAYQLTERGLEIEATFQFEAVSELRELMVPLPPGMQLISAFCDDRALTWHVVSTQPSTAASAAIAIPTSLRHTRNVTLRGWQPLVTNRLWQLPKLRPAGALWISGSTEILLAPTLELQRLSPTDYLQTSVAQPTDVGGESESCLFTAYSADAALEVTLAPRLPNVSAHLESSLALAETDVTGRLVTRLHVTHGNLHTLSGELAPGWTLESVETDPPETLAGWFVDRNDGRSEIEIQLDTATSSTGEITVIATGRLQTSPGPAESRADLTQAMSVETLRIVRWRNARVAQHLLTFQTVEPYVVEPIGGLKFLDPEHRDEDPSETPDSAEVVAPTFDLTVPAADAALRVAVKRGQYEADMWVVATYGDGQLQQDYHIVGRPKASHIDRLLIYATQPLGDRVHWTMQPSGAPLAAERLPAVGGQTADATSQGETWLVRLPHPTGTPVEIVAALTTPWSERKRLPLLSVPEAVEQRGRVLVRSAIERRPVVEAVALRVIPLPLESERGLQPGETPPVFAAYRYKPSECISATQTPKLWIAPADFAGLYPIIARRAELESFFTLDGRAIHRADYRLENQGADRFNIRLPHGSKLCSITLDGRGLEVPAESRLAEPISIVLPAGRPDSVLNVQFETDAPPVRSGTELLPPLLKTEVPLLAGDWTIWLPTEFAAVAREWAPNDSGLDLRQRLFGPLGRPGGLPVFDPFRRHTWSRLAIRGANSETPLDNQSAAGLDGWRAHRFSFLAKQPAGVIAARPAATMTWAIAILVLSAAAGMSIWQRHRELFVALVAIAAALALLLPALYGPLATGAFLGLVSSLVISWPRRHPVEDTSTRTWNRPSSIALRTLVIAAASLSSTWPGNVVLAQEARTTADADDAAKTKSEQRSNPAAIHKVLIPVGSDGRTAGTKTYVSERFLRELHRASARGSQHQWILLEAAYQGELHIMRADTPEVVSGDWILTMSIEVLARDTTIALPLVRDEAAWPETATVDGIPTPLVWSENGRECKVNITEPGRRELAILCVPRVGEAGGKNQIQLTIPPILGAAIRVKHPSGLSGITVVETALTHAEEPDEFTGELDGSGRLTVNWPRVAADADRAPGLRVTALQWLRIGVDVIELEAKYIVEGGPRRPESLTVAYDKRWKLQQRSLSAEFSADGDAQPTVRVPLTANETDRQEISLKWRLAEATALGRLRLPAIELISVPVTQRWLAISSDATLKFEVVDGENAAAGTANEFLALWGEDADSVPPETVLANIAAVPARTLAVQPRTAALSIEDLLHIAAASDGLRIQYHAIVRPGGIHEYQFPLAVSEEAIVDEVVSSQNGRRIPLRWSRDSKGVLTLFFSRNMAEQYEIAVSAHVPSSASATYAFPRIAPIGFESAQRVQLYRHDDVVVEVSGLSGSVASGTSPFEPPPPQWSERAIGAHELDQAALQSARLIVKPNRVQAAGQTLTVLSREADGWWAAFNCSLVVEQGELDSLKLVAPSTWTALIEIKSNVPATLEINVLDETRTALSVRLAEPLEPEQKLEVQLRGRVAIDSASPVAVPEIVPMSEVRGPRFVSVPTMLDSRPISWSETGVRPAKLPGDLRPPEGDDLHWASYEVVTNPFQVALRPAVVDRPGATVRLADTFVGIGPLGDQLVFARMVVVSQNVADCTLEVPSDQELLKVTVDGRPAAVRPQGKYRWRLPLGSSQVPQFVETFSRSVSGNPSSGLHFALSRPRLLIRDAPMPVEMSLWSFNHSWSSGEAIISGADRVSHAQQAASRLDRLVSISEAATAAALEAPFPDGYNWYHPWSARLTAARRETLEAAARPDNASATSQVMSATEEQVKQASERLDLWLEQCDATLAWLDLDPSPPAPIANAIVADPPIELSGDWIHCVAEGGDPVLSIELSATPTAGKTRLTGLAVIAIAAAATISLLRRPAAWDIVCRWPHAVAFLLGLAYWAYLWPSWVGIVIAIVSLLLALRSGWPGRSLRSDGSTVLRV